MVGDLLNNRCYCFKAELRVLNKKITATDATLTVINTSNINVLMYNVLFHVMGCCEQHSSFP